MKLLTLVFLLSLLSRSQLEAAQASQEQLASVEGQLLVLQAAAAASALELSGSQEHAARLAAAIEAAEAERAALQEAVREREQEGVRLRAALEEKEVRCCARKGGQGKCAGQQGGATGGQGGWKERRAGGQRAWDLLWSEEERVVQATRVAAAQSRIGLKGREVASRTQGSTFSSTFSFIDGGLGHGRKRGTDAMTNW